MNKKIIVQIPFNIQGFNKENELSEKWIKYRLSIFRAYCLKSLINQTNQYFTAMLRVREETLSLIQKELKNLPKNVCVVANNYGFSIRRHIDVNDYHWLYLVRMDSDDCYEENFIDLLHNYPKKKDTEVLISQHCYDYDAVNKRLASFWYKSPQSYTLIYDTEEYRKGKRYFLKNGHGGAIKLKHELLDGYNYLNVLHQKNNECRFHDSDTPGRKQVKEIFKGKKEILKHFGIEV